MTLSKSALKRAANSSSGPQRYKRLLSVSAASDDEASRPHRRRRGGTEMVRTRRDVETGQLRSQGSDDTQDESGTSDHFMW